MNENIQCFRSFPKIPRWSREIVITEKIDGTNGQITFTEDGGVLVGSRNRYITPDDDHHGFALWVHENIEDLRTLGVGTHFGEWWGGSIQKRYGIPDKRFSLFNVGMWNDDNKPECCHIVPVLARGDLSDDLVNKTLELLRENGSMAVTGCMNPEGIMVYHTRARQYFKKTLHNDEGGKDKGF